MKNRTKAAAATIMALALLSGTRAYAQRTMDRQDMIGLCATSTSAYLPDTGMKACWGRYGLTHHYGAWAGFIQDRVPLSSGGELEYIHLAAGGDFHYRILSTRSRSFCLYGGGGAFLGMELNDPRKRKPEHIEAGAREHDHFLYGCRADVEMEVYLLPKAALTVTGSLLSKSYI